jgi:hypothetical protein
VVVIVVVVVVGGVVLHCVVLGAAETNSGELSFLKSDLALDMVKMKIRSQDKWLCSVPCVHSLESTTQKIGESMRIVLSIDISIS